MPEGIPSPSQFEDKQRSIPSPSEYESRLKDPGYETVMEPPTLQDKFRHYVAPAIRPALSVMGEEVGGMLGLPSGPGAFAAGAGGAAIGNLLGQSLSRMSPRTFGYLPDESIGGQLKTAGEEVAGQKIAGAMGKAAGTAAKTGLGLILGKDLPVSLLRYNQGTVPKELGEEFKVPQDEQQFNIKGASNTAKANKVGMKNLVDEAYKESNDLAKKAPQLYFRAEAQSPSGVLGPNGQPVQSPPKLTPIEAPVPTEIARDFTQKIAADINSSFTGAAISDRPLRRILDSMGPVLNGEEALDAVGNRTGKTVLPYSQAKELRDAISEYLDKSSGWSAVQGGVNTRLEGTLANFSKLLSRDMDNAAQQWGPEAYRAYTRAKDLYIQKNNILEPEISQRLLRYGQDPEVTYNSIASRAMSDPERARQFLSVTGDRRTLTRIAMNNIYDAAYDEGRGTFDYNKALNMLTKDEAYSVAIPSQTLSNYKQLMKTLAQNTNPMFPGISKVLSHGRGGFGLAVYPITAGALMSHHPEVAAGTAASFLTLKGIDHYFDRIMSNPTTARAMIEAAKMPPGAPAASAASRIILNGLKGVGGLAVERMDGSSFPARVDDKGQVISDR